MNLADNIATHPKFFRAGELIGTPTGRAEALALFVAGVGYSRLFLTDGKIPREFVTRNEVVSDGEVVAKALSDKTVRLWHRVRDGYRIHDYHDWNRKASVIKQKRKAEVTRVRAYRKGRT